MSNFIKRYTKSINFIDSYYIHMPVTRRIKGTIDKEEYTIVVKERDLPPAVSDVTAANNLQAVEWDGKVYLTWDLATGTYNSQRIYAKQSGSIEIEVVIPDRTTKEFSVPSLNNTENYDMIVAAVEENGNITESSSLVVTPDDKTPVNLTKSVSADSITIDWDDEDANVAYYTCELRDSGGNVLQTVNVFLSEVQFFGLTEGTTYTVAVKSVSAGEYYESSFVTITATPQGCDLTIDSISTTETLTSYKYFRLTVLDDNGSGFIQSREIILADTIGGDTIADTIGGVATTDSGYSHSSYPVSNAFNGDVTDNGWLTRSDEIPVYAQFELNSEQIIEELGIYRGSSDNREFTQFKLEGSNDGSTWNELLNKTFLWRPSAGDTMAPTSWLTKMHIRYDLANIDSHITPIYIPPTSSSVVSGGTLVEVGPTGTHDLIAQPFTCDGGLVTHIQSWLYAPAAADLYMYIVGDNGGVPDMSNIVSKNLFNSASGSFWRKGTFNTDLNNNTQYYLVIGSLTSETDTAGKASIYEHGVSYGGVADPCLFSADNGSSWTAHDVAFQHLIM